MTSFEDFLTLGVGYGKDDAGVFFSYEDNSPLTVEQRALRNVRRCGAHSPRRHGRDGTPNRRRYHCVQAVRRKSPGGLNMTPKEATEKLFAA